MSRPINEDELVRRVVPKEHRSVRPRLSTKCPVTAKPLLDDMSLASATLATQSTTRDSPTFEDDPTIPPVTPSPLSSRSQSIFAHLTREIVNYQVRDCGVC